MKNRKLYLIVMMLVVAALALAACMTADLDNRANPAPSASFAPQATSGQIGGVNGGAANSAANDGAKGNTSSVSSGALGVFDWANSAADVESAIAGISEIADSRVVVTNTTALVGVKFDNAYKGELTERIREMVAAEVLKADPAIQTVAVTSAVEDVDKVYDLSAQIRAGRTADELSADINSIVRNATTLR